MKYCEQVRAASDTSSSLKELLRRILATLGRQVGVGLVQFLTLIVIARFYGPSGNGIYTVSLLVPTSIATLLNFGIGPAVVYFVAAGKLTLVDAWRAVLKIYVPVALLGMTLASGALFAYGRTLFPNVPEFTLLLALCVFPPSLLVSLVSNLFQGVERFKQFNLLLVCQPFVMCIITVVLALSGIDGVVWLIAGNLSSSLLAVIAALALLAREVKSQETGGTSKIDKHKSSLLKYGLKAHISNILSFVNYKADIFIVNLLIGPAAAGIYVVAIHVTERLWLISQASSTVLLPRLSLIHEASSKGHELTPLFSRWVFLITLLGALVLGALASPLIAILFGASFAGAVMPLIILLPGTVLGASSRILANDIAARGRPELNMYASFVVVAANIGLNILLIPHYGLSGAAIATSAAYVINFGLRSLVFWKLSGSAIWGNLLVSKSDIAIFKSLK